MKKEFIVSSVVCIMFLSSCIQFLHPLTADKNQMSFRKELIGRWKENDGTEYSIDSLDEKHYKLVIVDNNRHKNRFSDSNYFTMCLVNIQGQSFLDCYPDVDRASFYDLGEQVSNYILPLHYILKLNSLKATSIEIATLNSKEIVKLMDQKKFVARYDFTENKDALLLLQPNEIQEKLIELEKFPSAWDTEILQRF